MHLAQKTHTMSADSGDMDRRTLLRGAIAFFAGGGFAGCLGADGEVPVTAEPPPPGIADTETDTSTEATVTETRQPQQGTVSIEKLDAVEANDGTLSAAITVRNESDDRQVRLVRASITLNDTETVVDRFVTLEPGESETVRLPTEIDYQDWRTGGSYAPTLLNRTPETPLPTRTPTLTVTEGANIQSLRAP